jgi:hypothetical protein
MLMLEAIILGKVGRDDMARLSLNRLASDVDAVPAAVQRGGRRCSHRDNYHAAMTFGLWFGRPAAPYNRPGAAGFHGTAVFGAVSLPGRIIKWNYGTGYLKK